MAKRSKFTFKSNIGTVKKQMKEASEAGMEKVLLLIESAVKSGTPVMTGGLRDSINHLIKQTGGRIEGQVGTPLMYGIYVEFGTGEFAENGAGRKGGWVYQDPSGEWFFTWGQEPQHFMRNGFRQNKNQVKEILGNEYGARFKGK
ncbi:HK97 gp10 family phage protein [Vagococcus lutrae]|uniref:HK97-gp10 family putative phage morphogenesis protein n=1 Tax=Vagococcus lutrae TaxID=81947 RepID=UPI0028908900|nr:HK97-gp10 family putative phage morphogenesis protein [Vagococcus lutrae]MDT2801938.1 HK97 gp10 family phage protein [Vagococcus lutrae]